MIFSYHNYHNHYHITKGKWDSTIHPQDPLQIQTQIKVEIQAIQIRVGTFEKARVLSCNPPPDWLDPVERASSLLGHCSTHTCSYQMQFSVYRRADWSVLKSQHELRRGCTLYTHHLSPITCAFHIHPHDPFQIQKQSKRQIQSKIQIQCKIQIQIEIEICWAWVEGGRGGLCVSYTHHLSAITCLCSPFPPKTKLSKQHISAYPPLLPPHFWNCASFIVNGSSWNTF